MQTVAIFGVGLIGGSFALALRKSGFTGKILGVSSPETIEKAVSHGVIDAGVPVGEAASNADLVFLSQPIHAILSTLHTVEVHVRPGTLITDAGSTKVEITKRAAKEIQRGVFLGGHPMAGKESSGVEAADADLFEGRPWVLTPQGVDLDRGAPAEFVSMIQAIGARLVVLDPTEHDRLVALVSHLPQLLSTVLGEMLATEPDAAKVAGPALTEMTRLAMSPYSMWQDIFATNEDPIDAILGTYIAKLEALRRNLQKPSTEQAFDRAAAAARALRK